MAGDNYESSSRREVTAGNLSEAEVAPHSESLGQLRLKGIQPPARITLLCAPTPCPALSSKQRQGLSRRHCGLRGGEGEEGDGRHERILTPMYLYFNFLRSEFPDHLCASVCPAWDTQREADSFPPRGV